ncbi:MAG: sugar transferase [Atopobiaceae bacterium]|nr:sugar transferase [Atopobiaceae bacterium]
MAEFNLTDEQREAVAAYLRSRYKDTADAVHGYAEGVESFYSKYVKRAVDIAASSAALVVTLPINLAIAVGTYFDVGSPIFFKQTRIGKNGKPFTLIKFRNMTNDTDAEGNLLPPEERVTEFGRIMRTTSLDELLNFWSVLKGDMSIIGPRPLLPEYTDRYCEYHRIRLSVKPGLECPPNPSLEDNSSWESQFNNDVWYAQNVSLITDIKKFVRLFEAVFNKRSTKTRGDAGRSWFMGYDSEGHAVGLNELSVEFIEEALAAGSPDDRFPEE